ncbi:MAG: PleD family two-component system response regulator [Dehalococcoidia bacterium]
MKQSEEIRIPRILVVEGYVNHAKSISSHLEGLAKPLELLSAPDAETTLVLMDKETVSLLIIDVYLRGKMDGFDLCRVMRSSPANQRVPIILLLSGHLSLERSKGISAGADLLLHRPVVKEELFKMVQLLLEWRSNQATERVKGAAEGRSPRRLHSVG